MDEKLPKIRLACSFLFIITRLLFYAAIICTGFLLAYAIVLMSIPEESFTAIVTQTGVNIDSNSLPIRLGAVIPNQYIAAAALNEAVSAKWLNIINLLSDVLFLFTPLIFMLHYSKDTFFNIAYGNKPFTKESSFNLKILGVIIIACSLFCVPIKTLALSFVIGSFYILLQANLIGLLLGFLVAGLSYLFLYIQDIQEANVVLVQVLQDDVEKEIQQEHIHEAPQADIQADVKRPAPNTQLEAADNTNNTSSSHRVNDLLSFGQDSSDILHVFDEF